MNANLHRRTPSLIAIDGRSLPVRQIAYLRAHADERAEAQVTRQQYDAAGRLVARFDPRLSEPGVASLYDLSGQPLKISSVDGGWRLSLPGLAGQALQRWDARGVHWRYRYDEQLRNVEISNSAEPHSETFTYADARASADHNQRGRLLEQLDASGSLSLNSYSLAGETLRESRRFADARVFVTQRRLSPLGAVLEQTDAGGHRQQSRYDLAGQLRHLQLLLAGHSDWQAVLLDARFNAAGQIIAQQAGNGVDSYWCYEPGTDRLLRQWAQKGAESPLQDFTYEYDPVGNPTRILDHVFSPSHFANQRVDGERAFSYDTLYRLISASGYDDAAPSDLPGRPQPSDPNDRRNYLQTYRYDQGGNLTELCHVRDGACYTRQMRIDAASNRGVRWNEGDPEPDFDRLFDRHGNLTTLQPGQALQWNARDQLAAVTLIKRENALDDAEFYHYSQGVRVYKRHETYAGSSQHFHEVCYLPGLEIRSKDNGEELHVIDLATGSGHVSCLHWLSGIPPGIADDQLRYTLDDHLGSCVMELDRQARLISHEGYYPFGATAWMSASSAVEVEYKTLRYSGKEMDVSGLYYYGARYYAPWLQRWISADPGGDIDGLNLYAFVGNNPIGYFDDGGYNRSPQQLKRLISGNAKQLSAIDSGMQTLQGQLIDLQHPGQWRRTLAKNTLYQIGSAATGWFTSFNAATFAAEALPQLSGDLIGLTLGNQVADKGVATFDTLVDKMALNTPIVPQTSTFNRDAVQAVGQPAPLLPPRDKYDVRSREGLQQLAVDSISKVAGAYVPGVGEAMAMGSIAQQAQEAEEGLSSMKLGKIHDTLDELDTLVSQLSAANNAAFAELGISEFYDERHHTRDYLFDLALNRVGTTKARTVRQADLTRQTGRARESIAIAREFLSMYREKVPAIRERYRAGSGSRP
ncbi:RHS repeat-associated core domain-containing protein [Pseudomonas fluorescens]|uniref:RHS repeat-associated core domain-containing protein n=1 Tax=Pseudomonas fluorescens TaxID=294 RepID=UPI0038237841